MSVEPVRVEFPGVPTSVTGALVLGPGDQLVIAVDAGADPETFEEFRCAVEGLPQLAGRTVVVAGVVALAALRKPDTRMDTLYLHPEADDG